MAFETRHDLATLESVLKRIRQALTPDGAFLLIEFNSGSKSEFYFPKPYYRCRYQSAGNC
jgi:hypothetical protein